MSQVAQFPTLRHLVLKGEVLWEVDLKKNTKICMENVAGEQAAIFSI